MLLAAVVFLGSCDETADESTPWNTASGVTVSMKSATASPKENQNIINIPIEVSNNANGKVKVKIAVKATGDNPATEDEHYYVTTKDIVISDSIGNVEVKLVDDDEINDPRTFEVSIVSVEHASVGEIASTLVTIRDNDSEIYDRLQGTWIMTGEQDTQSGTEEVSWKVTITGASNESESDYNKRLYISGMNDYSATTAQLSFYYDETTKKGYVSFSNLGGYNFAENLNFGDPVGVANIKLYRVENNSLTTDNLNGYWDNDLKNITFDEGELIGAIFSAESGDFTGYSWFGIKNIKMTKSTSGK